MDPDTTYYRWRTNEIELLIETPYKFTVICYLNSMPSARVVTHRLDKTELFELIQCDPYQAEKFIYIFIYNAINISD